MEFIKTNKLFFLLPIFAFILYSLLWNNVNMTAPDTQGYVEVALDMQDGSIDQLNDRTPGFPILLLITNSLHEISNLLNVQLFLYIASVLALSYILYDLKLSKKLTLLFMFASLLPYNIAMVTSATTETLTTFTLVFGFFFFYFWLTKEKYFYLILSALSFTYAGITRPTYQLMFLILIFVFLISFPILKKYKKKLFAAVITLSITSLLILGSIVYINSTKFNFTGITPMLGFNLSTKTVTVIERLPEKYADVREILIKYRDKELTKPGSSHTAQMYIWGTVPDLMATTGLSKVELSKYMKELNLLLIKKAPIHYLQEVGFSIVSYWLPNISRTSTFHSKALQLLYTLLHFVTIIGFFLLLVFIFSFKFTSLVFKDKKQLFNDDDELFSILILLLLSTIFYTMFISTLVEVGYSRYRSPTDLFIFFSIILMFNFIQQKILLNNSKYESN